MLASAVGEGSRYRCLLDDESGGEPLGSSHTTIYQYFLKHPEDNGVLTEEKQILGQALREYWSAFAKTGVPQSTLGPKWHPTNSDAASLLGTPLMHLQLGNTTSPMKEYGISPTRMMESAWFTDSSSQLLVEIACGRVALLTSAGTICDIIQEEGNAATATDNDDRNPLLL